jgi:hypothetical protein
MSVPQNIYTVFSKNFVLRYRCNTLGPSPDSSMTRGRYLQTSIVYCIFLWTTGRKLPSFWRSRLESDFHGQALLKRCTISSLSPHAPPQRTHDDERRYFAREQLSITTCPCSLLTKSTTAFAIMSECLRADTPKPGTPKLERSKFIYSRTAGSSQLSLRVMHLLDPKSDARQSHQSQLSAVRNHGSLAWNTAPRAQAFKNREDLTSLNLQEQLKLARGESGFRNRTLHSTILG